MRRALLGIALALAAGLAGWWFLNLYSVPRPYDRFVGPTSAFLRAGLELDSMALTRMADSEPVRWALQTGRLQPRVLSDLVGHLHAVAGRPIGKATSVIFSGWRAGSCANRLLSVTFSGPPEAPRIQDISTDCQPRR